jgi:N6-adenosine-specific RNA methylase IME4
MAKRYRTIVADPPWAYEGMSAPWRSTTAAHYGLMSLDEIKALPVADWCHEDGAHLYLWAVLPMLDRAFEVLRAWGFWYSTTVTWCKPGPGLGGGWRGNTEHLIVGKRGKMPFTSTAEGTWYKASRRGHSAKPELFLDIVEQVSPGPYLEMFARRARFGWEYWGNESLGTAEMAA